jgi:hypothetical protein
VSLPPIVSNNPRQNYDARALPAVAAEPLETNTKTKKAARQAQALLLITLQSSADNFRVAAKRRA